MNENETGMTFSLSHFSPLGVTFSLSIDRAVLPAPHRKTCHFPETLGKIPVSAHVCSE